MTEKTPSSSKVEEQSQNVDSNETTSDAATAEAVDSSATTEAAATTTATTASTSTESAPKRKAARQITKDSTEKDDDDGEDDDDEPVREGFNRAPMETLQKRKIYTFARDPDGKVDPTQKVKVGNPFAQIKLVPNAGGATTAAAPDSKAATATAPSVFGSSTGFSGFGNASSASKNGAASTGLSFSSASGFGQAFSSAPTSTGFGGFASSSTTSTFGSTSAGFGFANAFGKGTTTTGGFGFKVSESDKASEAVESKSSETSDADKTSLAASGINSILPQDYVFTSGEENDTVLYEVRCKSFRWGRSAIADSAGAGMETTMAVAPSVPHSELQTTSFQTSGKRQKQDSEDSQLSQKQASDNDASKDKKDGVAGQQKVGDGDDKDEKKGATTASERPNQWLELGTGPLKILRNEETNVYRIVQRRESTPNGVGTKLLMNFILSKESKVSPNEQSDKHLLVSCLDQGQVRPLLIKFKIAKEKEDCQKHLLECIQNSKSLLKEQTPDTEKAKNESSDVAANGKEAKEM